MPHVSPAPGSATADAHGLERFFNLYPEFTNETDPAWQAILHRARIITTPANTTLVSAGQRCAHFMLLLEGAVRVYQLAEDGREMSLYRIKPGDICLMSLNSLLHERPFKANAATETACQALLLSGADFHAAMQLSTAFRNRVLSSLVNSVCDLMHTFYDTAFETLDMRLACLLGRLFERAGADTLYITHQQLAFELGTSREVVSRTLKKLERRECIRLARGQIRIGANRTLPGGH